MICIVRSFFVGVLLSWMFMASSTVRAEAPTDEVFQEIERQIEQQEAEQAEAKKHAQEEAKRKAEEEATKVEMDKQRAAEEEARRQAEEDAKKRADEEAKLKTEAEKKEKYSALIKEAEQAISNKDKELALNKYNEALVLNPGDRAAIDGINNAEKLKAKVCYEIEGDWKWARIGGMTVNSDGTFISGGFGLSINGTWECHPESRTFSWDAGISSGKWTLRDANCLLGSDGFGEACFTQSKGNSMEENQMIEESSGKNLPFGR